MLRFEEELNALQSHLLEMAGLVESAIRGSIRALSDRDTNAARRIMAGDERINQLEIENDEMATRLLALNQPVARDLRFITAALKINNDLERMGDLAVNIAERAIELANGPLFDPALDILQLAQLAEDMVSKSLQAFLQRDEELANSVLISNDTVEGLKNATYQRLVSAIEATPASAVQDVDLIFIVHNLERIAGHAANIAEDVLFFVKGIDVRHRAHVHAS
jgi:phosphate transport system protein